MKWFVHVDQPYYPSAHVVEARNIQEAIEKAWKVANGDSRDEDRISFVATPLGNAIFVGEDEEVKDFFPNGRLKGVQRARMPRSILGDPAVRAQRQAEHDKWRIARATYSIVSIPGASRGTF